MTIQQRLGIITEMTIDAADLVIEAVRLPRTRIVVVVHHEDPSEPDGGYVAVGARGYPVNDEHPELTLAAIANDLLNAIQTSADANGHDLHLIDLFRTRQGQG